MAAVRFALQEALAMKRTLFIATLAICTSSPALHAAPPDRRYQSLRYLEDYSFLRDPSLRTRPLDELKYIPLSPPDIWLSLGGEARTKYDYFRNPSFGLRGLDRDDYLLQRFLLHADVHAGEHFRTFIQLASGLQFGEESDPSPIQDDALDLQQAFVDVSVGDQGASSWTLRVGRQEFSYGSGRLVSPREPTNIRLNFDAVKAIVRAGRTTLDVFLARPVEQERGLFNDGDNNAQTFWGAYSVTPLVPEHAWIDVYYFGLDRENARFGSVVSDEERHSVGVRISGKTEGWDFDAEGVFQFGSFGGSDIRAWTLASNTGYTWARVPWSPRVGLKANIASGDNDPSDSTLGTFNALYPRQGYFSEINLLAPANFYDLHPAISVKPREELTLTASWDPYWRYSTDDAVYPPRGAIVPADASSARYVGSTLNLQADWVFSPQASLTLFYAHFFRGPVIRDAGGKDADYFGAWMSFRF